MSNSLTPDQLAVALSSPAGFAKVVDPNYLIPPHIDYANRKLVDLATGRIKRLIIMMPPRSGKSELVSRFLPPWFIGLWPQKRVILASYETTFAASWGRKGRDLMKNWGPKLFNVNLRSDTKRVDEWYVRPENAHPGIEYGGMITAGVGGPITGRGGDLIIIDDYFKNSAEALSKVRRQAIWDWYCTTTYTRLQPQASIVVMACLARDTHVNMADGNYKLTQDVRAGDEVLALDNKHQVVKRKVIGQRYTVIVTGKQY